MARGIAGPAAPVPTFDMPRTFQMDDVALAELVLFALEEESGIVPDGDLLERIEKSPPGARRRLSRLDPQVFALCALAPLELSTVLARLLTGAVDAEGRIDTEKAWDAVVATRDTTVKGTPDATADALLALAHTALGLPSQCQECADWQPEDAHDHDHEDEDEDHGDEDDEAEDDEAEDDEDDRDDEDDQDDEDDEDDAGGEAHEEPTSLLERVFTVHADALDDWAPQVAYRIGANAGDNLAEIAGFDVLHEVVGHRRRIEGIANEQRAELHVVQHVGMSLCVDAAQVHGVRTAMRHLKAPSRVADAYEDAERVSAEESGVLAAVIASVVVDRLAPMVEESLDSAPPKGPPSRPARNRRRR